MEGGDDMGNEYALQFGTITENDDVLIYEIPQKLTNLQAAEQLDELKRKDTLFFDCQHYTVDEHVIKLYYKREKSYQSLIQKRAVKPVIKDKIALNILKVDKLVGTQYTTIIHPNNIYVNAEGDLKIAHRGIRSVLPPMDMSATQYVTGLKHILLFLYTNNSLAEIQKGNVSKQIQAQPFIKAILQANSVQELEKAIRTEAKPTSKSTTNKIVKTPKSPMTKGKQTKWTPLTALLVGILIGLVVLYIFQVLPLSNTVSEMKATNKKNQEQYTDMKDKLKDEATVREGYQFALADDPEKAAQTLESVPHLDESAESVLFQQYLKLNTADSLQKASQHKAFQVQAVDALAALQTDEANDIILNVSAKKTEVKVEQAWLKKEYDQVIDLAQEVSDHKRSKLLAAQSYLQLQNPDEALKLAKQMKNEYLQEKSLKQKIAHLKKDKKLDKDDKKKQIDKIEKELKKLNK